jgi:outer membrane protein TolC
VFACFHLITVLRTAQRGQRPFGSRQFAVAISLLLAATGANAEAALSLAEALALAQSRSSLLTGADYAAQAAREMAVAAAQLPDPVATMGVNNLPINGEDAWSLTRDFMTMANIGIMQEFTGEEKREARAERFRREAAKSVAERAAGVVAIQRDTATAWLDSYFAEAMLAVVSEQSRQAGVEVDAAEGAYRAGRGNLADILAARSALVMLDDRASEVGRKVRAARIALARWIGDRATARLGDRPAIDAIALDPQTLDAELGHHPQVELLARQEEVAAADVRVAQANRQTDWSAQLMYSQRGSAYSNMISFNVSVPLPWDRVNRQDREVAAKLALRDQARAEREDSVRARAAELRLMIAEWENNRERHARYERNLLPLATQRTEATLAAYRGAKASLMDVLLARRGEIDVRLQSLQLEMDTARLWAQLNFLFPEGDPTSRRAVSQSKDPQ